MAAGVIRACVACGEIGKEVDFGLHSFAALPRIGECAVLHVNGEPTPVIVDSVHHFPVPAQGDTLDREPYIKLRVRHDHSHYSRIVNTLIEALDEGRAQTDL